MTQTNQSTGGNGPALIAYHAPERRNAPWLRIGAAWPHKDGEGYSLRLETIPLDAFKNGELTVQLRRPDGKEDESSDIPG